MEKKLCTVEVSQLLFLSEIVDISFCQSCPLHVHVLLTEQCYTFFSSLTFNRFRLSLLPVSMSEDHEGWVYLFLVMEIISCVHPFH